MSLPPPRCWRRPATPTPSCSAALTPRWPSRRAGRCRRPRPGRRWRTIARASTAGCSRIAANAAGPSTTTSTGTTRCSIGSAMPSPVTPASTEAGLPWGIDGCSAPVYALPLANLAYAFARLAGDDDDAEYGSAARTLVDAMTAHPEMVSGAGRSDLALATAGRGDFVAKIGAGGRAGDRRQEPRHRHRDQGRRWRSAWAASGDRDGAGPARIARRRPARGTGVVAAARPSQLSGHADRRSSAVGCPGQRRRTLRVQMSPRVGFAAPGPDFLNFARPPRSLKACVHRAALDGLHRATDRSAAASPDAAPAVRRAKQQMTQGIVVDG